MKKSKKIVSVSLIIVIFSLVGVSCSNKNINIDTDNIEPYSSTSNPFEDNENTEIMGSIGHGFFYPKIDENGECLPFQYDGGEFYLDYKVEAKGDAKNVGFLIFIDGKPQPYKVDDTNAPYEYLHNFRLEKDNEPYNFTFIFTPVTGKKGDTLNLTVASVYNSKFIPDMKETSSYGNYHDALPANCTLKFNKDADILNKSSYPEKQCLLNVKISSQPITNDFIENELNLCFLNAEGENMQDLNSDIFNLIYYNGNEKLGNLKLQENEPLHITFKICGVAGAEYENIFYINHQPISDDKLLSFNTKIEKGNVCVIDADIDVSKLDDFNTFYVISVPKNAEDYYEENVCIEKTSSILLYKDNLLSDQPDSVSSTGSLNTEDSSITNELIDNLSISTGNFDVSNIQGKIKNIYYANDGKVLISADKLYLYDIQNSSIVAESYKENLSDEDYRTINNGYAAIGILQDVDTNKDNSSYTCIFYDESLKQTKTIELGNLHGDDWLDILDTASKFTVSNDGNKLAFSTLSGLYLYDIEGNKKTTLIDFTEENNADRLGISSMREIDFTDNGNKIVFKAQSFDVPTKVNKSSFDTYGMINIDGTGLINKKSIDYSVKELTAVYDKFIVLAEDFETPTGKLMTVDIGTGKEKIYTLSSQKESGSIHCSDLGKYFATAILDDNLTVRIYNMDNGELLKEEIISDDNSLYFAREPVIRIIDNSKTCIVMLGNRQNDINTKVVTFGF